jgi:hypothetical protein
MASMGATVWGAGENQGLMCSAPAICAPTFVELWDSLPFSHSYQWNLHETQELLTLRKRKEKKTKENSDHFTSSQSAQIRGLALQIRPLRTAFISGRFCPFAEKYVNNIRDPISSVA